MATSCTSIVQLINFVDPRRHDAHKPFGQDLNDQRQGFEKQ